MSKSHILRKPENRKISKAEINQLPLIKWEGNIEILNTIEEMFTAVKNLQHETILGFDTETRPSFKKGEYRGLQEL